MKILLTGASGLLGNAYAEAAVRRGHKVTAVRHQNTPSADGLAETVPLDATDWDALSVFCLDLWPDAIVNCAAISAPANVEADPGAAERVNVRLPRQLAQLSTHLGARLIHISTDMVFDGQAAAPYRSTDLPNPRTLYGQTKLMAEREVLEHNTEDPVVLRIPILMGNAPSGRRSVHEKILAAVAGGRRPRLFTDEIRQPASAPNVAEVMLELTERRDLHGLFHWAGRQELSRYEMGRQILRHFDHPEDAIEAARAEGDPEHADRPRRLAFNLYPLISKLKTRPLDFREQLEELSFVEPLRG